MTVPPAKALRLSHLHAHGRVAFDGASATLLADAYLQLENFGL